MNSYDADTADATVVKYNIFSALHTGNINQLDFEVDLNGTGVSQSLRLRASSNEAADIRVTRAIVTKG